MTLNKQNNTINGFFSKNHMKMRYYTYFLALFVKNDIFSYLTFILTFWPWRWPWIITIISEMDCPFKITCKLGITLAFDIEFTKTANFF